jgi:methylenetetrahydrofolate dehydrogenase (NADP+)/methenyltetrahydrofolate cyclohydrolase
MQLSAKDLLARLDDDLAKKRAELDAQPGMALIWVGDDNQTSLFIKSKQKKAQELNCNFMLHHFSAIEERQLDALIKGLNVKKDIHGIVLQLPLSDNLDPDRLINLIVPAKDVDGLTRGSRFEEPTPKGIIELLLANDINPAEKKTVILGAGRLVGAPLSRMFEERKWMFSQIDADAESHVNEIRHADILISCTGKEGIVSETMVHENMVVVDGSGIDVDIKKIEPLVKAVTPKKGAIGPLTVDYLFANLLTTIS